MKYVFCIVLGAILVYALSDYIWLAFKIAELVIFTALHDAGFM